MKLPKVGDLIIALYEDRRHRVITRVDLRSERIYYNVVINGVVDYEYGIAFSDYFHEHNTWWSVPGSIGYPEGI